MKAGTKATHPFSASPRGDFFHIIHHFYEKFPNLDFEIYVKENNLDDSDILIAERLLGSFSFMCEWEKRHIPPEHRPN